MIQVRRDHLPGRTNGHSQEGFAKTQVGIRNWPGLYEVHTNQSLYIRNGERHHKGSVNVHRKDKSMCLVNIYLLHLPTNFLAIILKLSKKLKC